MMIRWALVATAVVGLGGAAYATESMTYGGLPAGGSPLYAPNPIAGDATVAIGAGSDTGYDYTFLHLAGRVNIPLHNGWNVEPDIQFNVDSDSNTYFSGVAHVYKRLPTAAMGFYAGTIAYGGDFEVLAFGVEAESYVHPNSIVGGRAHYASADWGGGWFQGEFWWDYFFTPNHKITTEVLAWAGTGGDDSGIEGTLTLTKRFDGTQISGFVAGDVGAESDSDSWIAATVGLTWNFDLPGTTQYQHDMMVPFTEFAL
jgi:hypothetical protein